MGITNNLLLQAFLNSGVIQYPDQKLYRSALVLPKEDRPTKPVRLADGSNMPVFRLTKPALAAVSNADKPDRPIFVNRDSYEYKNDDSNGLLLAGVLAHEAQHLKTGLDSEVPAYAKQISFLESTPMRNTAYVNELKKVANKHKDEK